MIAELAIDDMSTQPKRVLSNTHVRTLLPEPAMELKVCYEEQRRKERKDVRFPYIHNMDPDFFQSPKVLLSVNHTAVPL
jgi:hypothetical protein